MRKALFTTLVLAATVLLLVPAGAAKRSGIEGVIINSTCTGPCPQSPAAEAKYQGTATVSVRRARDDELVASKTVSDGDFRFRLRRGRYDVSVVVPGSECPPNAICKCPPNAPCACPQDVCVAQQQPTIVAPCTTGDTKRVRVRRHRYTHVELRVQNFCVAQPQQ